MKKLKPNLTVATNLSVDSKVGMISLLDVAEDGLPEFTKFERNCWLVFEVCEVSVVSAFSNDDRADEVVG